jgi:Na+-driven multidrug efflux pump
MQTGSDTEYALVVVALCVGMAYSFARVTFASSVLRFFGRSDFAASARDFFHVTLCSFSLLLFSDTSPPPLALRI